MDQPPALIAMVVRVSIMYVYALAMLRLAGKRSIGDLSPLDFAVAMIIGDMFDDVFWAEIPLAKGLVGLTTVLFLHTLLSYLQSKSKPFHNLVASTPTRVVQNSRFVEAGMAAERTPELEVRAQLRLQGEENLKEVGQASWEPSGQISVIKRPQAETAQKQDLPRLKKLFR